MANVLNEPQARAVAHVHGPLLVFAGAGSGKTSVITQRCASLIRTHGVAPARILMVTFTNKAAAEMRERIALLVGAASAKRIWAGTFHSICARFLRSYAEEIDRRRDFVIYDESDQETVLRHVVQELHLDKKAWPLSSLSERIGKSKQQGWQPSDIPRLDPETEKFLDIWTRYELWLRSCNALDFEDLILYAMRLAEGPSIAGEEMRAAFDHVLVDEFQDTNETQYRLVKALAAKRNLCVVGDDDQCIYSWRGATVANIRNFSNDFPNATVVKLEQNYRSTKSIVACGLSVIENSKTRVPKKLWTANPQGTPVRVVPSLTDRDEARHVAGEIRSALARGERPSSMAVLYRMHVLSRAIEDELRDTQVPYRIVGGLRFYDRKAPKDVLSYLRLATNHDSDVDLLRIINVPSRGIGGTTTKRLAEIAASRKLSLWGALPIAEQAAEIGRKERMQLHAFRDAIEQFGKTVDSSRPSEFAKRVIDGTGYRKMWENEACEARRLGNTDEAEKADGHALNADEVVNAVAAYEQRMSAEGEIPTLRAYLQMVSLVADETKDPDKVAMTTVHSAKGLEWERVWIVGFEDGKFPALSKSGRVEEEEIRLGYVAITRARKELCITYAQRRWVRGQPEDTAPSQFIDYLGDGVKTGGRVAVKDRNAWGEDRRDEEEQQECDAVDDEEEAEERRG